MIGISLGSQNTCIGVIKNNNVDIILTETSQRSLPTLVAFNDRERLYGDSANFTIKSNYLNTVAYPTRYLGLEYNNPFITEEAKYCLCPIMSNENNEVIFEFEHNKQKDNYTSEAIMGIFFDKLKQNWLKQGYNTKDIVVSVPDYYSAHERNSLIEATKIADLNCTSLVNESSAIAINYGLFRRNQFDDNTPRLVGFVDMGNCKTTVFFASFTKKNHKVLSVTSERFCGARDLDYLLMEHYGAKFKAKYGCDPLKNTKTKLRMIDVISKCRKILTGNKETTLNIDSLMEDEDMHFNITREEFEKICEPIFKKFKDILSKALSEASKLLY
jgi:heat shock protein 4